MVDTSFIIWVQQWSTPFWDRFWQLITMLGDLEFYMLAIPLLYWLMSKKFAFGFAIIFILSAYFNSACKYNFITERPPWDLRLIDQEGFAFPSGHAQGNTGFWGFLARHINKSWAYIGAGILVALVSFSRIYLGVHFPIDIIFGIAIGLTALALYELAWKHRPRGVELSRYLLLSGGAIFLLFLLHNKGDGPMTAGFLLGTLWGYGLEKELVGWSEKANISQNIIKVVLGLLVFFGLREITRTLFINIPGITEDQELIYPVMTWLRYTIMGFWVTLIAPWLFQRLRLYRAH